ncbi:hypothetical protein L1987_74418 [Smallanthus sonchifolius]|uniref:Uncharacterized protein n=1 Tax=Smallanthus sonchifolius TaxID=185202 RepID=A0ACB9A2W1_9ASTR|nr:hypothetical protein L1987_74418 [Smallanthus sonchifolius]
MDKLHKRENMEIAKGANEINIKYHNAILEARKLCPESTELSNYIKKFNGLFRQGVEVEDAGCGKELTAINSTGVCFYTPVSVKKQTYESGIWTRYCIDVADAYEVFSAEREKEERHISRNIEIDDAPDMSIGLTQGGEKRCTNLSPTKENTMPNTGEDIFVDKWNVKKSELCMLLLSLYIEAAQLERLITGWETKNNFTDCGVFVMRHMETYMGYYDGKWDCGFPKVEKKIKSKITLLRKKYAVRILTCEAKKYAVRIVTCEVNKYRGKVMKEAQDLFEEKKK